MGQELKGEPRVPEKELVSVVLPAYNEEATLGADIDSIRKALESTPYPFEIIVVDDCSKDGTSQVAESRGVRLIRHAVNQGVGGARKTGIHASRGNTIITSDCDGTYPHQSIPELLEAFHEADMVVGARVTANVYEPFYRTFPKFLIRKMASKLSGIEIPDLNSGLRVIRKSMAVRYFSLLPQGHSWEGTITLAFLCNGHTVRFVPIDYYKRKGGKSTFHPFRDTYSFIVLCIRTVMYFNPLRVLLPLSFTILGLTGIKVIYDWTVYKDIGGLDVTLMLTGGLIGIAGFLADLLIMLHKRLTPHV